MRFYITTKIQPLRIRLQRLCTVLFFVSLSVFVILKKKIKKKLSSKSFISNCAENQAENIKIISLLEISLAAFHIFSPLSAS